MPRLAPIPARCQTRDAAHLRPIGASVALPTAPKAARAKAGAMRITSPWSLLLQLAIILLLQLAIVFAIVWLLN